MPSQVSFDTNFECWYTPTHDAHESFGMDEIVEGQLRPMLTELRLRNFKAFGEEEQKIPLSRITLIYGPNSGGKSSLIQALLLLKQSVGGARERGKRSLTPIGDVELGSYSSLIHKHDTSRELGIGVTYNNSYSPHISYSVDMTFVNHPEEGNEDSPILSKVRYGIRDGTDRVIFRSATSFRRPVLPGQPIICAACENIPPEHLGWCSEIAVNGLDLGKSDVIVEQERARFYLPALTFREWLTLRDSAEQDELENKIRPLEQAIENLRLSERKSELQQREQEIEWNRHLEREIVDELAHIRQQIERTDATLRQFRLMEEDLSARLSDMRQREAEVTIELQSRRQRLDQLEEQIRAHSTSSRSRTRRDRVRMLEGRRELEVEQEIHREYESTLQGELAPIVSEINRLEIELRMTQDSIDEHSTELRRLEERSVSLQARLQPMLRRQRGVERETERTTRLRDQLQLAGIQKQALQTQLERLQERLGALRTAMSIADDRETELGRLVSRDSVTEIKRIHAMRHLKFQREAHLRNEDILAVTPENIPADYEQHLGMITHLGSMREPPERSKDRSDSDSASVGPHGRSTYDILYANAEIKHELNEKWFKEFEIPYTLKVHLAGDVTQGRQRIDTDLRDHRTKTTVTPKDVGFGISYLMPVLVEGLASPAKTALLCEQPEIHLHPRLHLALADFMIATSANNSRQWIVETHSETLILRLLRRIEETNSDSEDLGNLQLRRSELSVVFVDPDSPNREGSEVQEMQFDEKGNFMNDWPGPSGFFQDAAREI